MILYSLSICRCIGFPLFSPVERRDDNVHKVWDALEELEVCPTPVDAKEVAEDSGLDDALVGHHPLQVTVQGGQVSLQGELQAKVEEVGGQQAVKLYKVIPGPVNKSLLGHVSFCLQSKLYPKQRIDILISNRQLF